MTNVIHGIVASEGLCITTFRSIKASMRIRNVISLLRVAAAAAGIWEETDGERDVRRVGAVCSSVYRNHCGF